VFCAQQQFYAQPWQHLDSTCVHIHGTCSCLSVQRAATLGDLSYQQVRLQQEQMVLCQLLLCSPDGLLRGAHLVSHV
jgi:hypothetical protein